MQLRWTGLMRAAHNGHDKVVKLMLEHGANPDIKTRVCCCIITPLYSDLCVYCYLNRLAGLL